MGGHHHHHHGVESGPTSYSRAFAVGVALNTGFVAVEALFGYWSGSMALLADAGHNLSDVFALLLSWGALRLSRVDPDKRHTYGWRRSSQMASLINAVVLFGVSGIIVWESVGRLLHPQPVAEWTVIWVAGIGVIINTATALMFMSGQRHDINIRGAFLHMAADAGVSLGVIVAGLIVLFTSQTWIDPAIGLLIVVVILYNTWDLFRESLDLMLDAVPPDIDPDAVRKYLESIPGIRSLHDLHIWALSTTQTALSVHLIKPDSYLDDVLLERLARELRSRFDIDHATIQLERGRPEHACPLDPAHRHIDAANQPR